MANGLVLNGVVQPLGFGLGGLGSFGSNPGAYIVPSATFYAGGVLRDDTGKVALQQLRQGETFIKPTLPTDPGSWLQTCGIPGAPPCNTGDVSASIQQGLGGLGNFGVVGCSTLDLVLAELQRIKDTDAYGMLSSPSQAGLDNALSHFGGFGIYINALGNQCQTDTAAAQAVLSSLRAELGQMAPPLLNPLSVTPPATNPAAPNGQPDNGGGLDVATIVKWGAIGLVAVAGAYALGPIFRGIGGLIPSRKR